MQNILVITMTQDYPFFTQRPDEYTSIVVRRILQADQQTYQHILAKTTFIKNLKNKNLIKVEDIVIKNYQFSILYENVQSKYDWRDPQIITQIFYQLKNLVTYLANIGVKTSLKSNKIGITIQGVLKYFLGLQFQWENNKDDEFLHSFYRNQLKKLFGNDFIQKNKNMQNSIDNIRHYHSPSAQQKEKQREKMRQYSKRKVSFATLSSRKSRMQNIYKQMNMIKSTVKQRQHRKQMMSNCDNKNSCFIDNNERDNDHADSRSNINSQVNTNAVNSLTSRKVLLHRDKEKLAKKLQDRKFSGDIRNNVMSNKRLEQKQTDIKSQRGAYAPTNKLKCRQKERQREIERQRQKQRYLKQNKQQMQTINSKSKSRFQQMKYQEYIQIKKSDRNYLQDFISVLEDESPILSNILSSSNNTSRVTRPTQSQIKTQDTTTQALRIKTRQAILNSRKIINKVKGFPTNRNILQD